MMELTQNTTGMQVKRPSAGITLAPALPSGCMPLSNNVVFPHILLANKLYPEFHQMETFRVKAL